MRAIVACGWFGIQCWIGGHALQRFLESLWSGWPTALGADTFGGYLLTQWLCYAAFWSLNILIVYRGMELLRRVESWAAPYVLVMTTLLLVWILRRASAMSGDAGLGSIVRVHGTFATTGDFLASSSRASRRWSASGPRCRSTCRTSPATGDRSASR